MNYTKNDKISLIILTIFFSLLAIIFYGQCGNFLIDFSRETYIPYQISTGEKIYSDIFLIYGFFGYLINSILIKLTHNIDSLLILANIISYCILIIFYFICRKFLNEKQSFFFATMFSTLSIFSNSTFSFTLPYSFSTLWAILGVYLTILGLLYDKKTLLYISLGFISINRIEYFIIFFTITTCYLLYKKEKINKNLFFILLFPVLNLIYLITQEIEPSAIVQNINHIKTMAQTNAINYFYKGMGTYFEINQFIFNVKNLAITSFFSFISYQFFKKEQIFAVMFLIIPFSLIHFYNIFNLIFIYIFIGLLVLIKKNLADKHIILLTVITIGLNLKCLFKTSAFSYSNFGYVLAILLLYLILRKLMNKTWLVYFLVIFLIGCNIENADYFVKNKKIVTKTNIGSVFLKEDDKYIFDEINNYIVKNIDKNESFIVVPEGQIFNLIHKKPWGFYNSTFTPLDFETFGEDNIIEKLDQNKTDYIIFYPRNTKEYGAKTICYDYGIDFCEYIIDNYERKAIIDGKYRALIFKAKK